MVYESVDVNFRDITAVLVAGHWHELETQSAVSVRFGPPRFTGPEHPTGHAPGRSEMWYTGEWAAVLKVTLREDGETVIFPLGAIQAIRLAAEQVAA